MPVPEVPPDQNFAAGYTMHRKIKSRARKTHGHQTEQIPMAKKTLDQITGEQYAKELILKHYRRMYPGHDKEEVAYMANLIDWLDDLPWPPPKQKQPFPPGR